MPTLTQMGLIFFFHLTTLQITVSCETYHALFSYVQCECTVICLTSLLLVDTQVVSNLLLETKIQERGLNLILSSVALRRSLKAGLWYRRDMCNLRTLSLLTV